MKLKAVYKTLEEIPQDLRENYTERDGQYVLSGVEGIKTQADVDQLKKSLDAERDEHKKTKQALKKFGDVDPETLQDNLDELEELRSSGKKKLDDTAINEIVERRVKKELRKTETERDELKLKFEDSSKQLGELQSEKRNNSIESALRKAAEKIGVRKEAMDDVLARKSIFDVSEDGKIVTRDGCGVTPGLDPENWIAVHVKTAPHWVPPSRGADANPGSGNAPGNTAQTFGELVSEVFTKS
ncbi:MAG: hypothetical protein A2017_18300 [Lentisphaerae bacterium GWF2_44_16]|nr:MAG: hypothetical protein A2017_18300 [Lentisphaerae bacterium GWF2_44_16]